MYGRDWDSSVSAHTTFVDRVSCAGRQDVGAHEHDFSRSSDGGLLDEPTRNLSSVWVGIGDSTGSGYAGATQFFERDVPLPIVFFFPFNTPGSSPPGLLPIHNTRGQSPSPTRSSRPSSKRLLASFIVLGLARSP